MKKITYLILTGIITVLISGCSEVTTNIKPAQNTDSYEFVKKSEFQRGYEKAIKDNKQKWIKTGYEKAKKALRLYKRDMQAYEAGKYALKEKLVTYPRVIAYRDEYGAIKLKSLGCEIKPMLSSSQILDFYSKHNSILDIDENEVKSDVKEDDENDNSGAGIEKYNQDIDEISKVGEKKEYTKIFKKTYKFKKLMNSYNLNCSSVGDSYACNFSTKDNYNLFCKTTGVCK